MRTFLLIPIAYVAGVQGFVFFAPYLVVVLGTVQVARLVRARRTAAIPVEAARVTEKHPA